MRQFSVDIFELVVPAGSRSGNALEDGRRGRLRPRGEGCSLHWEVQEEIADKYYARSAKQPTPHEIKEGDTVYVPEHTVVQHFAADGSELRLLASQNRVFEHLGYDRVHCFEDAPEYTAEMSSLPAEV